MGFRLIRENTLEYQQKMILLKKKQLEEESERWRNLTVHSPEERRHFLNQFVEAQNRIKDPSGLEAMATQLHAQIRAKNLNIVTIQGNMDISRLRELLDDLPLDSTPLWHKTLT